MQGEGVRSRAGRLWNKRTEQRWKKVIDVWGKPAENVGVCLAALDG